MGLTARHPARAITPQPAPHRDPLKRMRCAYLVGLLMIAALVVAGHLVQIKATDANAEDAPLINVAGRQRMLSQKISKAALSLNARLDAPRRDAAAERTELKDSLALWSEVHRELRDAPEASPAIRAAFAELEPHAAAIERAAAMLLHPDASRIDRRDAIASLMDHEGPFLARMDAIVEQYTIEAGDRLEGLKAVMHGLLGLTLLALVAELFLIYEPVLRLMRRFVDDLRRSRANASRLAAIIRSSPEGIAVLSPDGRIHWVNDAFDALLGDHAAAQSNEPAGLTGLPLRAVIDDPAAAPLHAAIRQGEEITVDPVTLRQPDADPDDAPMRVRLRVYDVEDEFREDTGWRALFVQDVTARTDAEARAAEAHRSAGMAEVAADILHNIGNVLGSVTHAVDRLRERLAAAPGAETTRVAELIEALLDEPDPAALATDERARALPAYLRNLSAKATSSGEAMEADLARVAEAAEHIRGTIASAGSENLDDASPAGGAETLAIEDVVRRARTLADDSSDGPCIQITTRIDPALEAVGRRLPLIDVVVNLIVNSVESITTADTESPRILIEAGRIATGSRTGDVFLSVRDNGAGFTPEIRERLFVAGFSTRERQSGRGLHWCANTVRAMGGTIRAESDGPGRGALFIVTLPAAVSAADLTPPPHDSLPGLSHAA